MMIHIERVYPRESKKIIIWQKLWNWILVVFDQFFFALFSKEFFFAFLYFLTYQVNVYGFGIDF